MPRTEHLANFSPNHIYALNAQVRYVHHAPSMTTAVIEDEGVQSKIKIPQSLNNIREEIQQGMNYHFGFCYIAPNGWINARNPDNSIRPLEENPHAINQPLMLSDIANNSNALNGKYLTTLLYVLKVNEAQQIVKNGKSLKLCIVNCYANGYLVDVTLWNSDLPLEQLNNKWVVFSGFRLKKLIDWKFVLVSSVYSKLAAYEGETKSIPYTPHVHYFNLSCVFEPRTISQMSKFTASNIKYFSQTEALLKKVQNYNYDGCSVCRRKIFDSIACTCVPNTDIKVYTIQKLTLVGPDQATIQASVFDQEAQKQVLKLSQPTILKFNIKTTVKSLENGQVSQSHIIAKVLLL